MKCPHCGGDNTNDAIYCQYCCSSIKQVQSSPTTVINQNVYVNNSPQVITDDPKKKGMSTCGIVALTLSAIFLALVLLPVTCTCAVCASNTSKSNTVLSEFDIDDKYTEKDTSIWLGGYTDINDFDYYIKDSEIYVEDYNGNSEKIRLSSTYSIDGQEMPVVSFVGSTFFCDDISSAVIPEGTRNISFNAFNSCGINYVYLPSTLEKPDEYFWRYFHDVEKIYYGGTEEEWMNICPLDKSDIDAKEIIYETNSEDLK